MQKLSRRKFEQRCKELGIGDNQSMFFKTGLFQKFTCSPFCSVESISTSAKSAVSLKKSFRLLCQKYQSVLIKSSNVIVHFIINETFPFFVVQEIMQTINEYVRPECSVVMGVKYHQTHESKNEYVYIFCEGN